jgi:GNAT superfamily N-acetyltransferase
MPRAAGHQDLGAFRARPLTPATWPELEQLFSLPGGSVVRGCWCMYYRESGQPAGAAGAQHKQALCDLVSEGTVPGLVGYFGDSPVGWISLGPREDYLKLRRSSIMKPVDDTAVWSVVCSYVARPYRGMGVQRRLLAAAIGFARDNGVRVLEAYPVDKDERSPDYAMFFGSRSLYARAGFTEVARRSPTRVVMRRTLRPRRPPSG